MKNSKEIFAILAAIIANVLWGSTFMVSKVVLAYCQPATATVLRFLIALLCFSFMAAIKKNNFQFKIVIEKIKPLLALGLFGYTGLYAFQMIALKYISSSHSASIMLLAPIFTLSINSFIKRKISFREIFFIFSSFVGATLILFDKFKIDFTGIGFQGLILTLIASCLLGASVIQTKSLLSPAQTNKETLTVFNLTFYSLLIGGIGLIPLASVEIYNSNTLLTLNLNSWLWLLYLGVICSVVAFLLWNWSIKYISPIIASISMYLKTPVALVIGAIILVEKLNLSFYLGTTLIFISLFANQLIQTRSSK